MSANRLRHALGRAYQVNTASSTVDRAAARSRSAADEHDPAHPHQILAYLPAMLFTSRPDGLWDYINPPFCAYTGYAAEALVGLGWAEALHADDRDASIRQWRAAIRRGTPLQVEHRLHSVDGSHHWVRTHCAPQRNAAGAITRWAGIATPVELTSDVAAERALRRNAELSLDSVVATAAHELRAPITVLLGQAQLQQRRLATREHVDPGDQRAADQMVAQSIRLSLLINALLDATYIDHGQLHVSLTTLDLGALVQRVIQTIQPTLHTHTLRLISSTGPIAVKGDSLRLEQVLQNLLQNAVTYSPAGSEIVVTVAPNEQGVQISVCDQGCGVAASVQPHLFQRYYRAEPGDGQFTSGLGLGLYICKAIMDLHGGSIMVESMVGAGSTFTLLLPSIPLVPTGSTQAQ